MLIDTPYSYDGVSTCCEESVECWVQLQGIDYLEFSALLLISLRFHEIASEHIC